jgi:hypothetical protein
MLCNKRAITLFTKSLKLSLTWARSIQSITLRPTSLRAILILSNYVRLGFRSCLFPFAFPTNTLYEFLSSHFHAAFPTHLMLIFLIILIILGEEYKLWSSSLYSLLQTHVTSAPLVQNILLSTLFSNTLSLCSSPNAIVQGSHPNRTTSKIMILCILSCLF